MDRGAKMYEKMYQNKIPYIVLNFADATFDQTFDKTW